MIHSYNFIPINHFSIFLSNLETLQLFTYLIKFHSYLVTFISNFTYLLFSLLVTNPLLALHTNYIVIHSNK